MPQQPGKARETQLCAACMLTAHLSQRAIPNKIEDGALTWGVFRLFGTIWLSKSKFSGWGVCFRVLQTGAESDLGTSIGLGQLLSRVLIFVMLNFAFCEPAHLTFFQRKFDFPKEFRKVRCLRGCLENSNCIVDSHDAQLILQAV